MVSMPLISIVPRLSPATDGLGDYALRLARELQINFGIKSGFIVCDPTWVGKDEIEGFPVVRLKDRSAASLKSSLIRSNPSNAVLLHYVGYGYARRGAPIWLINGLKDWRAQSNDTPLLTMFHEVYASGPLWTSSFWLSSLQKHLAASLARLSDSCLTSRRGYAEILNVLSRNKHLSIPTLPVFSNIGEPEQRPLPLKARQRRLVVFGGRSNRARVYKNSLAALERVCRALAIEEVLDIGPPTDSTIPQIKGISLSQAGKRPAAEISDILSNSIAGFFDYDTAFLAKSTIFAAYSAHGMIPVSAPCENAKADGLEAGKHFWIANPQETTLSLEDGQSIADNAYAWYQTHKLSEHVKTFAEIVNAKRATHRENYSWLT